MRLPSHKRSIHQCSTFSLKFSFTVPFWALTRPADITHIWSAFLTLHEALSTHFKQVQLFFFRERPCLLKPTFPAGRLRSNLTSISVLTFPSTYVRSTLQSLLLLPVCVVIYALSVYLEGGMLSSSSFVSWRGMFMLPLSFTERPSVDVLPQKRLKAEQCCTIS